MSNFAERPTPPTLLEPDFIAENPAIGVKVYRFTWELPANNESIDIKLLRLQIDDEPPTILVGNSTEIMLPLSYGQHSVNIVAVDRCNEQSKTSVLNLDVVKGECSYYYT